MQEVPYGDLKLRALSDEKSSNLRKHQSKNPLQRVLINNFYRTLVSIIPNIEYKTILDVGCGEGFTINKLQKKFNADHYGFDISADAIEFLRNQGVQGEFKAGSLEDIQYSKKFDLVICSELLEHLKSHFGH